MSLFLHSFMMGFVDWPRIPMYTEARKIKKIPKTNVFRIFVESNALFFCCKCHSFTNKIQKELSASRFCEKQSSHKSRGVFQKKLYNMNVAVSAKLLIRYFLYNKIVLPEYRSGIPYSLQTQFSDMAVIKFLLFLALPCLISAVSSPTVRACAINNDCFDLYGCCVCGDLSCNTDDDCETVLGFTCINKRCLVNR